MTADKNEADHSAEQSLSLSRVFQALGDARRRRALYYLRRHRRPVPVDDLVRHIATRETGPGEPSLPPEEYGPLVTEVTETHLPLLAEVGVVEYDASLELVRLADDIRPLDEYLHLTEQHEHGE